jgi:pyroglutamyl-peptidase
MPRTILLTGYEPFDRYEYNPSGALAAALNGRELNAHLSIRGVVLPVDCEKMPQILDALLRETQPVVVIGLGLAFGETGIRVERTGHNLFNIVQPDNGGHVRPEVPILEGAPAAYFSTLPVREIANVLVAGGIPAYVSENAGGHLCNQFLYTALHRLAWKKDAPPCGFLHLPATPDLAAKIMAQDKTVRVPPGSMSLDLMQRAVLAAMNVTLRKLLEARKQGVGNE